MPAALFLNVLTTGTADNHLILEGGPGGVFLCGRKIRRNASLHVVTVSPDGFLSSVLYQCPACVSGAATVLQAHARQAAAQA